MPKSATTVIIGAGPYGLAISAYLKAAGLQTMTFGKPLEFWRKMPRGLCLKSVWSASNLSDPARQYHLDCYIATHGIPRPNPIPLGFFLDYGQWFLQKTNLEVDQTYVQKLARDGHYFRLSLADGREVNAERVIVATGITNFTRIPEYARNLPPDLVIHTQHSSSFSRFQGKRIAMIGSGQGALEYAALLHEAGAEVEIIARGPFIWHSRLLYERVGPARHIFYPPGDVGPPGINWIIALPGLFRRLPEEMKQSLQKRSTRPAGAKWLRPRVEGVLRLTPYTWVEQATPHNNTLNLKLSDGSQREIDFLFLGTGYQPDLMRLPFIDSTLLSQINARSGYPILTSGFVSSVPNLHFAGALAGQTFGPACRFLSGAHMLARQVTRYITQIV